MWHIVGDKRSLNEETTAGYDPSHIDISSMIASTIVSSFSNTHSSLLRKLKSSSSYQQPQVKYIHLAMCWYTYPVIYLYMYVSI